MPDNLPRVSVVIGSYRAAATIGACLAALREQSYRDFETIVVDSSPDDETARVVSTFPEVQLERSERRLYCHEARNRGVSLTRGELLVCLDADVSARPEWLTTLVEAYDRCGHVIVGAIGCHGRRLTHRGIHLCKFSKFLPTPGQRLVDTGPTANLLIARSDFKEAGGLQGERYAADSALSRSLIALGKTLTFVGTAVVEHQHTQSVGEFLRERFVRGNAYGKLRASWLRNRSEIALYLAVSITPVRLLKVASHVVGQCWRAGELRTLALSWPLVLAGHAASLLGESVSYSRALLTRTPAEDAKESSSAGMHEPLR